MVNIGTTPPIVLPLPSPTNTGQGGQVGVVVSAPAQPLDGIPDQVGYNAQVAEQKRADAVQALSQQAADNYVLGDQEFTIFKDVTGQYITRFTSLRDGKVTYFPEPVLYKAASSGGDSGPAPLVNISA
jgi:hypothetical protein